MCAAERGGFEPTVQFDPHTAFPVPHNRPLCHLSGIINFLNCFALCYIVLLTTPASACLLTSLLTLDGLSVWHATNQSVTRRASLSNCWPAGVGRKRYPQALTLRSI